jgi:hypothetical protein
MLFVPSTPCMLSSNCCHALGRVHPTGGRVELEGVFAGGDARDLLGVPAEIVARARQDVGRGRSLLRAEARSEGDGRDEYTPASTEDRTHGSASQ